MRFRLKLFLLPLLLFSALAVNAHEQEVKPEIFWLDASATRAMFIPDSIIEEMGLRRLPITSGDAERLENEIVTAQAYANAGEDVPCVFPHGAGEAGSDPAATTIEGNIDDRELAFTGEVIGQVSGWSTWGVRTVQMVYVQVDEIFKNTNGFLEPGNVVAYSQQPSSIEVLGAKLCARALEGFSSAGVGETVLILADIYVPDERFVQAWIVLPVVEEMVLPEPYPQLGDQQPRFLGSLTTGGKEAGR